MKSLPFILMIALVGCSKSEVPATHMSQRIQQWVPNETTMESARQIMEQHQFACSVQSHTNMAAMTQDTAAYLWQTGIKRNGKSEAVTNMCLLNCRWTDSSDHSRLYDVTLRVINGETDGPLTVKDGPVSVTSGL